MRIPTLVVLLLAATATFLGAGCDFLPESGLGDDLETLLEPLEKPEVTVGDVTLKKNPGLWTLGAYYCPVVFDDFVSQELCSAFLGPVPPDSQLIFRFQLPLHVKNPNSFPLPAVELLTALSLFPGEDRRQLAAVCVGFCEAGDLECLDPAAPLCSSEEPEITSREDLVDAALNTLALYIESQIHDEVPPELEVKLIPAGADATIMITFDLYPDPLLEALEVAYRKHLEEIIDEEEVTIVIPYDIEGTLWFVVENFGRFGVTFGPVEGEWTL